MNAKNIVIVALVLVLAAAVGYLFTSSETTVEVQTEDTNRGEVLPVEPDGGIGDGADPLLETDQVQERGDETIVGTSVEGTNIVAYHFGQGDTELLLLGGVHGSYSPNTSALANDLVDHFKENEDSIPANLTVTVIPNLNPDGTAKGGTEGRFNARDVDLNRNFDCEWSETAVWQNREVSGGPEAFSEPESASLRNYIETYDPAAAIVWFSAEGKVYPSACEDTPNRGSVTLAAAFATAAGYPSAAEFDAYTITGDMVNWMAKQGVSAISVLLSDHQATERDKNLAGVEAVLNLYAE